MPGAGRPPRPGRTGVRPSALLATALVLVGAGVTVLGAGLETDERAIVVGGNLPVNAGATDPADISAENSPTLARNPLDGRQLAVAARIDSPAFSCALHVSSDGGGSWSQVPVPAPVGEEAKCFAPEPSFGADGNLYVSFVTLAGGANVPNAAWLVTSGDGGRSLSAPTRIAPVDRLGFQLRLMADPAVPRRLYAVWLQAEATATLGFPGTGYPIRFARSDDGGTTWAGPERVSDPARQRVLAPSLAVGPRGELYVAYLDLGDDRLDYAGGHGGRDGPAFDGPWELVVARSVDRGAAWTEAVADAGMRPIERFVAFLPPFPSLAVDSRNGRLFVGFHDARAGDADVWVWRSDDGARTFAAPTRVNPATPQAQYLPKLAVAPDGRLDALYYDRRHDPADVKNEVMLQSSFDGGESFTSPLTLTDGPFDSRIGFGGERGLPDLGSRLALLATRAGAYAVWTDTRGGTRGSGKQDLVRAVVEITAPDHLPGPARAGLGVGGLILALAGVGLLATGRSRRRSRRGRQTSPES